ELHVHRDQGAPADVRGDERRSRVRRLEVLEDRGRLVEDQAVLLQRRHTPVRVERQVLGGSMSALRHVDRDQLRRDPLLDQGDADAARERGERMLAELHHDRLASTLPSRCQPTVSTPLPTFCRSWMYRCAAAASVSRTVLPTTGWI